MLPFIAMSIEFFVALGPVVIYFRSKTDNKVVAHYRAMRVYNRAYLFLVGLVVFYTISFNLAIDHDQAVVAYTANISALALAAQNMDGALIKVLNLILNIFAVVTAFFAMFLSFRDACTGIVLNLEPIHECRCHSEKGHYLCYQLVLYHPLLGRHRPQCADFEIYPDFRRAHRYHRLFPAGIPGHETGCL